jgi:hypothetical protein
VLARANQAKNFAKSTEKGRVAAFTSAQYRDEDLVLI